MTNLKLKSSDENIGVQENIKQKIKNLKYRLKHYMVLRTSFLWKFQVFP